LDTSSIAFYVAQALQYAPTARFLQQVSAPLRQAEADVELKSAPLRYRGQSRAPHQPARKVFFGAIHMVLELQKICRYAGWFRIKGYPELDYGIRLSPFTLKSGLLKDSNIDEIGGVTDRPRFFSSDRCARALTA
jgi:hypothetical protein